MRVFITGIPGAGKTTLAGRIAKRTGATFLTAHDLVEKVDPAAISEARMADEAGMRNAFVSLMAEYAGADFVMDGWPRNAGQAALLPEGAVVLHLRCTHDIAQYRLSRRGRVDDTPETIATRLVEQEAIFNGDWIRQLAPWARTINTSKRTAADLERTVMLYLTGQKREVF